MEGNFKLEKLLRGKGYSVTRPRLAVFEALQKTEKPLSVAELAHKLKNIDKTSVYRTIDLFESTGIIHRVWAGFKSKVELSEEFSEHHHHFTCLGCGKVISFDSEELEKSLEELENSNMFKLTHHSVELSGYCTGCSKKRRPS